MTYRKAPCGVFARWLSGELPTAFDEDYSASEAVLSICVQAHNKQENSALLLSISDHCVR